MLQFSRAYLVTTNKEVFDQIAESWYRVRHWPLLRKELEELAQKWQGGRLLNIGCGHGADFLPFRQRFELWGVDFSPKMLKQAQRYATKFSFRVNLVMADMLTLPFSADSFDWVIAVAVYHHIKGKKDREAGFVELTRILKPGGEAFLTVWNRGQPRFWLKSKEQEIPWRLRGKTVYRYYHLFSYKETRELLTRAGLEILSMMPEKSYRLPIKSFSRNICALVKKS